MAGAWSLASLQWRGVAVHSRGCAMKSDGQVEMIVLTRFPSLPQVPRRDLRRVGVELATKLTLMPNHKETFLCTK